MRSGAGLLHAVFDWMCFAKLATIHFQSLLFGGVNLCIPSAIDGSQIDATEMRQGCDSDVTKIPQIRAIETTQM